MYIFGLGAEQQPATANPADQLLQTYVTTIQAAASQGLQAQINVATEIFKKTPEAQRADLGNKLVGAGVDAAVVLAAQEKAKSTSSSGTWLMIAALTGVVLVPLGFALWRR